MRINTGYQIHFGQFRNKTDEEIKLETEERIKISINYYVSICKLNDFKELIIFHQERFDDDDKIEEKLYNKK